MVNMHCNHIDHFVTTIQHKPTNQTKRSLCKLVEVLCRHALLLVQEVERLQWADNVSCHRSGRSSRLSSLKIQTDRRGKVAGWYQLFKHICWFWAWLTFLRNVLTFWVYDFKYWSLSVNKLDRGCDQNGELWERSEEEQRMTAALNCPSLKVPLCSVVKHSQWFLAKI